MSRPAISWRGTLWPLCRIRWRRGDASYARCWRPVRVLVTRKGFPSCSNTSSNTKPAPSQFKTQHPKKMNKKEKIQTVPIISREALDVAVAEVATLKIQYAAAKADMELEIASRSEERR